MSNMPIANKNASMKASNTATQPFNEYDDLNDPNDLPPAYEPTAGPSVPQNARPPSSVPYHAPTHATQGYPGAQYHAQQWPHQGSALHPPFQQAPFQYPPGFFCPACRNTGIKMHNGHPCGQCERTFGRQAGHVQYAPHGSMPMGGVTYMAGDPRIGGRLCGNCKGNGVRSTFLGLMEEQCKTLAVDLFGYY